MISKYFFDLNATPSGGGVFDCNRTKANRCLHTYLLKQNKTLTDRRATEKIGLFYQINYFIMNSGGKKC